MQLSEESSEPLHGAAYYWAAGSYAVSCVQAGLQALEAWNPRCWCGLPLEKHVNPLEFKPRAKVRRIG